jgi:hypothetical protein
MKRPIDGFLLKIAQIIAGAFVDWLEFAADERAISFHRPRKA